MSEILEEFFNGFCKNYDMARTAIGEFREEDGKVVLDQIDCDYDHCLHRDNCEMMKKVFAYMEEKNREQGGENVEDQRH